MQESLHPLPSRAPRLPLFVPLAVSSVLRPQSGLYLHLLPPALSAATGLAVHRSERPHLRAGRGRRPGWGPDHFSGASLGVCPGCTRVLHTACSEDAWGARLPIPSQGWGSGPVSKWDCEHPSHLTLMRPVSPGEPSATPHVGGGHMARACFVRHEWGSETVPEPPIPSASSVKWGEPNPHRGLSCPCPSAPSRAPVPPQPFLSSADTWGKGL